MYTIDNCVLIRTTDIFPINGIIETPVHGHSYGFDASYYIGDLIRKKFRDMGKECPKGYEVIFERMRSTIHFTINGIVVLSNLFTQEYPFIIIEPFKHHINDKSLINIREEDTYFNDDMHLSKDCVILMDEAKYEELKDRINLSNYNIMTYTGNANEFLKKVIEDSGYPFFRICDHGYSDVMTPDTEASKMRRFLIEYAKDHNISQEKHFYSDINYEDAVKRNKSGEEYSKKHLIYILNSGLVESELATKIKSALEKEDDEELDPLLEQTISNIDLEKLMILTQEFNKKEIEKLQKPTVEIEPNTR